MFLRTEGIIAMAGASALAAPLTPPVTANLLGIWQIDGTGSLVSTTSGFTYAGRLNDINAIQSAMGGEAVGLSQWDDLSGNGNHATCSGSRPYWEPTGGITAPSIRSVSGGFLTTPIEPGTGGTMYCVVKPTVDNQFRDPMGSAQYVGSGASIKLRNNRDLWFYVQQSSGVTTQYTVTPNAYAANDILRLGLAWDSTNLVGSLNGTEYSTTHARDTSTGSTTLRLFGDAAGFDGYGSIFLYYSAMHDSGQRSSMMSWLADNYIA